MCPFWAQGPRHHPREVRGDAGNVAGRAILGAGPGAQTACKRRRLYWFIQGCHGNFCCFPGTRCGREDPCGLGDPATYDSLCRARFHPAGGARPPRAAASIDQGLTARAAARELPVDSRGPHTLSSVTGPAPLGRGPRRSVGEVILGLERLWQRSPCRGWGGPAPYGGRVRLWRIESPGVAAEKRAYGPRQHTQPDWRRR